VLLAYGTCAEAMILAPLVMELRRTSWLYPVVAVPGQRSLVLDELHQMLRIEPEADLDEVGYGTPLGDMISLALGGWSASFERGPAYLHERDIDVVVVASDTTTAFAVALAGFHARLPVVHVGAGQRTMDASFAENQLGRSIAQAASLHLASTPSDRAHLLQEGIDPADVVVTGPLNTDEHVAALTAEGDDGRAVARARAAIEDLLGIGRRLPDFSPPQAA
jgi:UDP-N-acetylglucosamine 2-epimerase (non-hydrolysing)